MTINIAKFERFLRVIDDSGVVPDIEARLRPAGQGGRPRGLRLEVLLAGLMATASERGTMMVTEVYDLLTVELDYQYQKTLGLRTDACDACGPCSRRNRTRCDDCDDCATRTSWVIPIHRIRYLFDAIEKVYRHTPATAKKMDSDVRGERKEGLQSIADQLLAATTGTKAVPTHFAVDATSVEAWGRGKRRTSRKTKSRPITSEKDGAWGYRTKTYGDKRNVFHGYLLTGIRRVPASGDESVPSVIDRILLHDANITGVSDVVDALDRIRDNLGPVQQVVADRAYSNKSVKDWARPLRERGIDQVLDMMPADHGPRLAPEYGFILLDGWPHDPSIPQRLHHIVKPARLTANLKKDATPAEKRSYERRVKEIEQFRADIAERHLYAYKRHQEQSNGARRWKCPHAAGKLRTPGCIHSPGLPAYVPQSQWPAGAQTPKACTQSVLQTPAHVGEKHRQKHEWGSLEWEAEFGARSAIEASFGNLKQRSTGDLSRGWTQQRGYVKVFLLLTLKTAALNIKALTAWAKRVGDTFNPLTTWDVAHYGHREMRPDGTIAGGVSPPTAN